MATSQFDSTLERREADLLGMWAFLATEVVFFGPLFFGYAHGRLVQPQAFVEGSHHMHSVRAAQKGGRLRIWLALTALFGLAFLGIKASEWVLELGDAASATGGEARF